MRFLEDLFNSIESGIVIDVIFKWLGWVAGISAIYAVANSSGSSFSWLFEVLAFILFIFVFIHVTDHLKKTLEIYLPEPRWRKSNRLKWIMGFFIIVTQGITVYIIQTSITVALSN